MKSMGRLNKKRSRSSSSDDVPLTKLKHEKIVRSRSSSSDDEPLTQLKHEKDVRDNIPNHYLFNYRLEKCEICEEVFENRFQSLVHGANHIIIPLWKQKLYQCPECLFYYQSLALLNKHISIKHLTEERNSNTQTDTSEVIVLDDDEPEIVLPEVENTRIIIPNVKTSVYVSPEIIRALVENSHLVMPNIQNPQIVPDVAKTCLVIPEDKQLPLVVPDTKTPQYEFPDLIKSRFLLGAKKTQETTKLEIRKPEWKKETPATKSCQRKEKKDRAAAEKIIQECQPKLNGVSSSKSCIVFEEDDDDDPILTLPNLMNDLTTECKDSVQDIKPVEVKEVVKFTESIHYDDLVKPGLFRCKICLLTFPNKLQTIVHEASHVSFTKDFQYLCPICEKYIAGGIWGLRRHKTEKHIQTSPVHAIPSNCKKCKLKFYNYYKHDLYYHKIFVCPTCSCRFEVEEQRRIHIENVHNVHKNFNEKKLNELQEMTNLHACDVCVMFIKSRGSINYKVVGEKCEVGKSQICDMCNVKCFEVKVVKRVRRPKLYLKVDKKPISSNMERLKKIQNRLSVISKMNKY